MIPHPIQYTMPRYSDDWVISKSLFEYTTGVSPVPDLDTIFETDGDEDWVVSSSLEEVRPPFPNFHPEDDETNEWQVSTN